jgi:hypothetical protein
MKRNLTGEACQLCRFYDTGDMVEGDDDLGICRRRPPVMIERLLPHEDDYRVFSGEKARATNRQIHYASVQPITEKLAWCGEFERYVEPEQADKI